MSNFKRDDHKQSWEDVDFPLLCETCLGDNPYVRMTKEGHGAQCKICERPYTVFRWKAGRDGRHKRTVLCQTCCKLKNVCQCCILDLKYGLPTQVRDTVLGLEDDAPKSDVNRDYYANNMEAQMAGNPTLGQGSLGHGASLSLVGGGQILSAGSAGSGVGGALAVPGGAAGGCIPVRGADLGNIRGSQPYYKRNQAKICSFFVKGECNRGLRCPYRHEMPNDPNDPLSKQNYRDRYYGKNDPVANKILTRMSERPGLVPPEDKSVSTIYVGKLGPNVKEAALRDFFYQFGEIRKVLMVAAKKCCFVSFTTREAAERCVEKLGNQPMILGSKARIMWGKSQGAKAIQSPNLAPVAGLPSAASMVSGGTVPNGSGHVHYPSQDPQRLGATDRRDRDRSAA